MSNIKQLDLTPDEINSLMVAVHFYSLHSDEYPTFKDTSDHSVNLQKVLSKLSTQKTSVKVEQKITDLIRPDILLSIVGVSQDISKSHIDFLKTMPKLPSEFMHNIDAGVIAGLCTLHKIISANEFKLLFDTVKQIREVNNPMHKELYEYVYCDHPSGANVDRSVFEASYNFFKQHSEVLIRILPEF